MLLVWSRIKSKMNYTPLAKRVQVLTLLTEGNSLRATSRITGVSLMTVTKILVETGKACSEYQDRHLRNLNCRSIQCDEIWSFCYAKQKNVTAEMGDGCGDVWTWTAIDADTRLMLTWMVGKRDAATAKEFMMDVASRVTSRPQLSSDGYLPYKDAVEDAFGSGVDFGMLEKQYGTKDGDKRYQYTGSIKTPISGNPQSISTSYIERANLTMRTNIRRFTRKTNGFSKKVDNHALAVSLHFMFYNFCRIHKSLKVTPAMQAGVTDRVWDIADIAALVPDPVAKKRGPYKKRISI